MTGWPLVGVFVGIAVAGLIMVVCFAVWLWRKATALLHEVAALLDRVGEVLSLMDEVEQPGQTRPADDPDVPQLDLTRQPAT